MKTEEIVSIIGKIADRIEEEKFFLTELDNAIADGDHGINLARGFKEVKDKLSATQLCTPTEVFKTVAMALIAKTGGAAGPLYGSAFLGIATAMNGKEEMEIEDFILALKSGMTGVANRGRSTTGEKTMLDSMSPAISAMEKALKENKPAKDILKEGVRAAFEGVEYTKTIAATKGRASYIGDRSIGHQDPGATSFSFILEEVEKNI